MRKSDNIHNDPWDPDFYKTGSTHPPKQNRGLITVLLVVVLLLGGLCSAMGIINIHLLQRLAQGDTPADTVPLFEDAEPTVSSQPLQETAGQLPQLGVMAQTVSDFDRRFYELPQGVLVTEVLDQKPADLAGLRSGDVITSFHENQISTDQQLLEHLEDCQPGQTVVLKIYRSQTQEELSLTITISSEEAQ